MYNLIKSLGQSMLDGNIKQVETYIKFLKSMGMRLCSGTRTTTVGEIVFNINIPGDVFWCIYRLEPEFFRSTNRLDYTILEFWVVLFELLQNKLGKWKQLRHTFITLLMIDYELSMRYGEEPKLYRITYDDFMYTSYRWNIPFTRYFSDRAPKNRNEIVPGIDPFNVDEIKFINKVGGVDLERLSYDGVLGNDIGLPHFFYGAQQRMSDNPLYDRHILKIIKTYI